MSVLKYDSDEEVIARANASEYGLAASVFTTNIGRAHHFAKGLRAGTIWVNNYGTFDASLAFGGFKQSGIGRELGESGLEPYLERKTVIHNLA
jgi:acyl-CoA reductase-like NAD-dependent aldehyde dehydrogenase